METQDVADLEPGTDLESQQILSAAAQHDTPRLRVLLRTGSASPQDPETGRTPLHAAIAACESSLPLGPSNGQVNGHGADGFTHGASEDEDSSTDADIGSAAITLRILLENGAIWNDVDKNNETPGCLALRLGLHELYAIMVDAGVRAEMLLSRLDEYERLSDVSEKDEEEHAEKDSEHDHEARTSAEQDADSQSEQHQVHEADVPEDGTMKPNSDDYLHSTLSFQGDKILDGSRNGVMMAWETDIMKRSADLLVPREGLKILNVGHGMGIIDGVFQGKQPSAHHIIEAHPDVLAQMKKDGWYEKPNVTIHEGKWQDVVPKIMEKSVLFDAIYFDTFAEDYKALRDFFSDQIIGLLEDEGKWGFFNGLGADRQICYDVYSKVVEMDLFEAGFDTEWETVQVAELANEEWKDVRRRYWVLKEYKLPICSFAG